MIPRFELFKDRKKLWRFRLRARNGRIIACSEAYNCKENAYGGIESIRNCVPDAVIIIVER